MSYMDAVICPNCHQHYDARDLHECPAVGVGALTARLSRNQPELMQQLRRHPPSSPFQLTLAASSLEPLIPDLKIKMVLLEPGELVRLRAALFAMVRHPNPDSEPMFDYIDVADVRFMEDKR